MSVTNRENSLGKSATGRVPSSNGHAQPSSPAAGFEVESGETRRPPATMLDEWYAARARWTAEANRRASFGLTNYFILTSAICTGLFFLLWWLLQLIGDETPWLPSGLIASITMIGLVVTRAITVRRFETRSVLRRQMHSKAKARLGHTAALSAPLKSMRAMERHLLKLNEPQTAPAQHLEAYRVCEKYLTQVTETLAHTSIEADVRAALRAGSERIRNMQKRHLLLWARKESQQITADALRQPNVADKIYAAERAHEVLSEFLRIYPMEEEVQASAAAVREFVASIHVMHWIELAEREVFKGNYEKAADHYRDALFDLTRADIGEDTRREVADKITREVELLRAHKATSAALSEHGSELTYPDELLPDTSRQNPT